MSVNILNVVDERTGSPEHCRHQQMVIGQELYVGLKEAGRIASEEPITLDFELAALAGAIGCADRLFTRKRKNNGWSRTIKILLPVTEPNLWGEATPSLQSCLSTLTGDHWLFEFRASNQQQQALEKLLEEQQLQLRPWTNASPVVISYSGGLDSLLGLAEVRAAAPQGAMLLAQTDLNTQKPYVPDWKELVWSFIKIPTGARNVGRKREITFRTRSFMFFTNAFITGRWAGASKILVPENGIGSLGPWLTPVGGEHPYHGTHPSFTTALMQFLNSLYREHGPLPTIGHPWLWYTKGQMVRGYLKRGDDRKDLLKARSCSHNFKRHMKLKGWSQAPSQCGICGGCLLTRISLCVNQLDDWQSSRRYLCSDLTANTLENSIPPFAKAQSARVRSNDREIAACAVSSYIHLINRMKYPIRMPELFNLANGLGITIDEVDRNLNELLKVFRSEWEMFLDNLPHSSWVRQLTKG